MAEENKDKPVQADHGLNVDQHDKQSRDLTRHDTSLVADDVLAPNEDKGDEAQEFHGGVPANEGRIQFDGNRRMTFRGVESVPPELAAKLNDQARKDREKARKEEEKKAKEQEELQKKIEEKFKGAKNKEEARAESKQENKPEAATKAPTIDKPAHEIQKDGKPTPDMKEAHANEGSKAPKPESHVDVKGDLEKKPEASKPAPVVNHEATQTNKPEAAKPEPKKEEAKPAFQPEAKSEESAKVEAPAGQRDNKAEAKKEEAKPAENKPAVDPAKQTQAP